jgi:flavin-dependent dehydrogenase
MLINEIEEWDVIIIGGALAGCATAFQLKDQNRDLKVLIIEQKEQFDRRVGESTVEISSYFLGRILGLTEYLNQNHLVKQGLRFWFKNDKSTDFESCSEIGPKYTVSLAAYQVDRSQLDEHVLQKAVKAGVELWRPAQVKRVELDEGGMQTVEVVRDGVPSTLRARWVVDASGVVKFLARKFNWSRPNDNHPIAAIWSRWSNVRSWDDAELHKEFPAFAKRCFGVRHTATNHLIGKGWWSWWIPLKGGDMSIGLVYDPRICELPEGSHPIERMRELLGEHPLAGRMLERASYNEEDVHYRKNLSYSSEVMAGDGLVLWEMRQPSWIPFTALAWIGLHWAPPA